MTNLIHITNTSLSDMFKDAEGFRPRHYKEFWTHSELEEEYGYLQARIEESMATDALRHKYALESFNTLIEETIALGAADRKTAIRWLMDAENVDTSYRQDVEHFFWNQGLSFEMIDKLTKDFALYYLGAS